MGMYCFQCQETAKNVACTVVGVCGKKDDVANLQDLLMYAIKGISIYRSVATLEVRESNELCNDVDFFIFESLFMTITNANFDREKFIKQINSAIELRDNIKASIIKRGFDIDSIPFVNHDSATFTVTDENIDEKAASIGILTTVDEDTRSLRELLISGLKGIAAYGEQAFNLKIYNKEIVMFIEKALISTIDDSITLEDRIALVMECGKFGVDAMSLLDGANTSAYGNPEITQVKIGTRDKPAILISGHDLKDLEMLLDQTKGTGVDVYTHSEMLPAHAYPFFKKYDNLYGNYGNAWWKQNVEFESFNGPILFTTNCITTPKESYKARVYTTGASGFSDCVHIDPDSDGNKDFSVIIEHAKKCNAPTEIETGTITTGFAHNQVISLADKVIDAVNAGDVKRFVVMAGCDGRQKGRNYYTGVAEQLPTDSIILTAGCAKYRYNKLDLGDIGGIPRVLDAGQCNDSFSLVKIALALKDAFKLDDINDLPISYDIAWYEQKAVIVLLALLFLGVKGIRLGPTLPAFLSPNVAKFLIENFDIKGIGTVESDIEAMMAGR